MSEQDDRVHIPVDIEREDRILAGLTARQVAILAVTGVALWLLFIATRHLVPLVVFAVFAFPIGSLATVVALGRRDGVGFDRLLVAAWRQLHAPRRLVLAPEGVPPTPAWVDSAPALPAPLRLPVQAIARDGVIDLGADGVAVIAEASTVSFALRTASERAAWTGVFGGWLNSLSPSGSVQIVVRAEDVAVTPLIEGVRERAVGLAHPALEQAAREHADFLAELAEQRDLLRRRVYVVIREPASGRDDGGSRVIRRADEAARALAGAGISVRVLEASEATRLLAACCDPWQLTSSPGATAAPDDVITGSDG